MRLFENDTDRIELKQKMKIIEIIIPHLGKSIKNVSHEENMNS